jgi:soluble lytic murein transglycosylase-like protein
MNKSKRIYLALVFLLIFGSVSNAYAGYININRIITIESHGNDKAYNKGSGARGLCQITPICLKEWNNFHKSEQYTLNDLWNAEINKKIAIWYLEVRIPQMLRHFGIEVNTRNILICYNAGIDYLVRNRKLKQETVDYIKKYEK